MTLNPNAKKYLVTGSFLLALAVIIGAFGAHGLKSMVGIGPDLLNTFETGVRYHFYHAFAILILGVIQLSLPKIKLQLSFFSFLVGTLLFSFNLYFYVMSGVKIFAIVVPLGGVVFILGWLNLGWQSLKLGDTEAAVL